MCGLPRGDRNTMLTSANDKKINVLYNSKLVLNSDRFRFQSRTSGKQNGATWLKRSETGIRSTETEIPHIPAYNSNDTQKRRAGQATEVSIALVGKGIILEHFK